MSQIDDLLGLGISEPSPTSPTSPTKHDNLLDDFDPFSSSGDQLGSKKSVDEPSELDELEPENMSGAEGDIQISDTAVFKPDKASYEDEFAELMGDFASGTTSNVVVENGNTHEEEDEFVHIDGPIEGSANGVEGAANGIVDVDVDNYAGTHGDEAGDSPQGPEGQAIWASTDKDADVAEIVTTTTERKSAHTYDDGFDYKAPRRVFVDEKKESGMASNVVIMGGSAETMCKVCGKRVYEMEKMVADKAVYHKTCFKCSHCKRVLSLGNFASLEGNLYCKPHFLELFKAKGNYEEGFGMERRTRQWGENKPPPTTTTTQKETSPPPADDSDSADVVRAEDKVEDDRDNLPSIRNLKSRFETKENGSSENLSTGKKWNSGELSNQSEPGTRQKQSQTSSIYQQFERGSSTPTKSTSVKKPSKWDKPKDPPPPPVNRQDDEETNDDVAMSTSTRNLVSQFQGISDSETELQERKPVRKMTPPREELQHSVDEYHSQVDSEETFERTTVQSSTEQDELPPPSTTKNMLARFKSIEDIHAPPPAPHRTSPAHTSSSSRKLNTVNIETEVVNIEGHISHISPDSGVSISESVPLQSIVHEEVPNGGVFENEPATVEGLAKESDQTVEDELPEQGFTRNLLAQWRNLEKTSTKAPPRTTSPGPAPKNSWSYRQKTSESSKTEAASVETNGHVDEVFSSPVRESDVTVEDDLPQVSYTKNMLQQFKSYETQEDAVETTRVSPQRQFKWQVKETHHLAWPGSPPAGTTEQVDYEQVIHADDPVEEEDEKPAPATTRNLRSRFQSEEDAPPPTPEVSSRKQQAAVQSIRTPTTPQEPSMTAYTDEDDVGDQEDVEEEEELPEQGTTRNLLAKFQSMSAH